MLTCDTWESYLTDAQAAVHIKKYCGILASYSSALVEKQKESLHFTGTCTVLTIVANANHSYFKLY